MAPITTAAALQEHILFLEMKQATALQLLQGEVNTSLENLRPVNLIKKTITKLTGETDVKKGFIDAFIGLAAGYLSEKIMVGKSHNPIKKLLGAFLQVGITGIVSKNAGEIRTAATGMVKVFSKKNDTIV